MTYRLSNEKGDLGEFRSATGLDGSLECVFQKTPCFQIWLGQGELTQALPSQQKQDLTVSLLKQDRQVLLSWTLEDVRLMSRFGQEVLILTSDFNDVNACTLAILEQWARQWPQERGQWSSLDYTGKHAWLDACTLIGRPATADPPPNQRYVLEGEHIIDYPSFFLAMGEAIHGPTGYFGRNLDALNDCLRGGYDARPPFVIEWCNHEVARQHLGSRAWVRDVLFCAGSEVDIHAPLSRLDDGGPLWDDILSLFDEWSIGLILS